MATETKRKKSGKKSENMMVKPSQATCAKVEDVKVMALKRKGN